ncbi:MAG: pilQ [Bacteroidetes bacterium]|nr:pilQ [Bacteroidota bacterium]
MKKTLFTVTLAVVIIACFGDAWGQAGSPSERKAFREYTSPEELVSIAPSTTLDRALAAISDVSKKFVGKVVVDTERRSMPIGVDVQGMQWRDALEAICRKNELWYTEYENYIQITSPVSSGHAALTGAGTTGTVSGSGMVKEFASFKSREVKISAYFFAVNLSRIEEVGINWTFMKNTSNVDVIASLASADKMTNEIFEAGITPKLSFANIDILAKVFSGYNLGEILSGPQLVVRSGEEGRIQVGKDFSVKERDFAGNVIDKFYSAGTIITVTPQVVTENGVTFIHTLVAVERSDVEPGTVSTIVNKAKANTNLLMLDGEEVVIGGLYTSMTSTVRTGVPFLKDLPWYILGLRYIFGYNKEELTKQELVILLKAELVPTLQERIAQKQKDDGIFQRWRDEQAKMERHISREDVR